MFYSFRRCPYAMRARLALASAQIDVEHREILLRDKPTAMLEASPKGTVPVLIVERRVIDESLDIMHWALEQNDPEHWLDMPGSADNLVADTDGPFKSLLDRYKYASRIPDADPVQDRTQASTFLMGLNSMLTDQPFLYGNNPRLADMAIATFVRQFAHVDLDWFNTRPWPGLIQWLDAFKGSDRFLNIMQKHPLWQPENP